MELSTLDYGFIIVFFSLVLGIGIYVSKKSGKNSSEFFLSGRTMPWWLLGLSMVATTFSTDTPNLVTDIVRTSGVSGNWVWWCFLLTGMLTVFVYAKLWRKSNVKTDLEFYEMRYGGKPASFLRKFRSIYLGALFNVITMASVTLAAIKIGGIMLGLEPWETVVGAGLISVLITMFIIPIAVQWWSSWYPGAEPGGGGYIAQRMLAAKDENHAIGATFFFNIMHYALRPWPWILVALASLVVYPDIASIASAFPEVAESKLGHDLAYSAMLTKLPSGLLGVVLASLVAAYMSTISTQLNWGSSYIVFDFYKQQINPDATEKQMVAVGRISTVILMVLSALLALTLQNAFEVFDLLVTFGAGTGLVFILRWFWWRINAWSEITAMFASGIISILLVKTSLGDILFNPETGVFPQWANYPFVVVVTTAIWVAVTFMTKPESDVTLRSFYKKIQPGGPGWAKVVAKATSDNEEIKNPNEKWSVPSGIGAMILGVILVYTIMFATGYWIYGDTTLALILSVVAIVSGFLLKRTWSKMKETIL